jgi:amidase
MQPPEVNRPLGKIRCPSLDQIRQLAEFEYMNLTDEEAQGIKDLCNDLLNSIDRVDDLPQQIPKVKYPQRDIGYRPSREEDPFNIFITKCYVRGASSGKLLNKKVGIKDNISLQGVLMTNASRLSETYIPNLDATIVTRLLDEGAIIVGKLNMDDYSFSGTSETSIFGAVRNPLNPEYSPGGSSSGSGAAVANGDVDIAIGVDQGGSARVPACCNGVVSMKATHGLVPSFGIAYLDHTFDFVCPIARTVKDVALALEVMAGPDENDPQWTKHQIHTENYSEQLEATEEELSKIKIGTITESVNWQGTDPDIKNAFSIAIEKLESLRITTTRVSVPLYQETGAIWLAILVHSISAMIDSCGEGYWHGGYYNSIWNEHIGRARKTKANHFPPLLKGSLILGRYLRNEYFSVYHSKAQNLRNQFRRELDKMLEKVDVLATPTMIIKPPRLEDKISFAEAAKRGVLLLNNTIPFNLSGHPAITVPCGLRGGLPVGMQLISKHFHESTLFKVAHAFEKNFDFRKL